MVYIKDVPNWYVKGCEEMQLILYNLRKNEKHKSQKEMGELLGISTNTYGSKERGQIEFTQDEMFKLSEYFGKPIEEIFLPRKYHIGTKDVK